MLSSDGLKVSSEKFVVDFVESYLKHWESLPLLPEEDPKNDWTLLTEEEKAKRNEIRNKQKEEEKKLSDAAAAQALAAFNALVPLKKIQKTWNDKCDTVIGKCKRRTEIKRLSKS